jgi:dTDP-4-amino-4,6-dideoxygalactose transaminase
LKDGWTRRRILDTLNEAGIPCNQGSCSEIYLERAFDNTGWRPEKPLPVAHELGEKSMMFMVHPTLTRDELDHTCTALRRVMTEASH